MLQSFCFTVKNFKYSFTRNHKKNVLKYNKNKRPLWRNSTASDSIFYGGKFDTLTRRNEILLFSRFGEKPKRGFQFRYSTHKVSEID